MSGEVRYVVEDAVACVTMDRPPVNAMTEAFLRALVAALHRAAADDGVRAVVIDSAVAGRFSAGLDLSRLTDATTAQVRALLTSLYIDLFDAQYRLGKPSVAAVNGAARGGGMTLAISCDVIVASRDATFGYPEIDRGLPPAIHFVHLPRIVGRHRAFELLFGGRSFGAAEAVTLGLVSRVAEPGGARALALEVARGFAAKPAEAVRLARAAFLRQNDLDYRRGIAAAVEDFCNGFATDAARDAIRAFAEPRGT